MINRVKFFVQDLDFVLPEENKVRDWIIDTISVEGKKYKSITYVFVNDEALHKINVEHLSHDTLTDIITFPYNYEPIESEIYISIDRVRDNALAHGVSFGNELNRVIIHGVLHMIGYGDKSELEANLMREKENFYLEKF